jgi:peptidoglycan/LPS O-acetylase OafA/YrhL
VVIFHLQAMQIFLGRAWFQKLSSVGYVGVSFFFVLSGFILVYTYAGRTLILIYFSAAIPYPVLHTALLAPAFAAIVYGFALRPRWGAALDSRFLVLCGDASYSLYLLHSMIMGMFFHTPTGQLRYHSLTGVLVFTLLAVGISALVYRFIEEPARCKLNPRRKPQVGQLETQAPSQPALA